MVDTIKEVISKVSVRTKCNSGCPIWPCILQPAVNPNTLECALQNQTDKERQNFARIFLDKEDGLNTLLLENAFLITKIREDGPTLHELMQLTSSLIEIKKSIYGSKQTIIHGKTTDKLYDAMQSIAIEGEVVEKIDDNSASTTE